jgi:sRNA-binding protein
MSLPKKQAIALRRLLMERFPKAFPKDYDAILPLKLGIEADILMRLAEVSEPVDPNRLHRVLANHVGRAGYLLALIHRRDGRRYDLDGNPAGEVDALARSEAVRLLSEHQKRQRDASTRHRQHKALEKQQQRARAERVAERERRAAEKQRRREENERHRQPGTESRRGAGEGGSPAGREAALAGSGVP